MPQQPPASDDERIALLVLAAGQGRRMGGPKALMTVGASVWWREQERQIADVARELPTLRAWWVVSPMVETSWLADPDRPTRRVVVDSSAPMFSSIAAGVRTVFAAGPPGGVMILPVDVPVPREPGVWRGLLAAGPVSRPVHAGVHGHPVYLSWPWVAATLWPRLDDAEARLDELIAGDVRDVAVEDATVTWNLNTPDDVRRFERVCSA